MEDLMRHARLFDPAEMMPMYDAIRKIQNHMANLRQGELLDNTLVKTYKRIHDVITNTLNDERTRQELMVVRSKSEMYDQRQNSGSFIVDDRLVEIPNYPERDWPDPWTALTDSNYRMLTPSQNWTR